MKRALKITGFTLLGIIAVAVIGFILCIVTEYRPADIEKLEISSSDVILDKSDISIVSWNTGYAGLDAGTDFFMDGGKAVHPKSKALVRENMDEIENTLDAFNADFYILQEVDYSSTRTRHINQTEYYLPGLESRTYARNFKTLWIPYPLPMLGHMDSGICTLSNYAIESSERIKLPSPFSWPMSLFNLKRCMNVSYIPIEGSDSKLVLINFHLEAYDSGEGKIAQTKMLLDYLSKEYEKGNYIIAGGDFNQRFPGGVEAYPQSSDPNIWAPGSLDELTLGDGWQYACDFSVPSCRSLDKSYTDAANHQFYPIDGFIISPNVELISIKTHQKDFQHSDHNPVELHVTLK